MRILAIDFETANDHKTSACAIGISEIQNGVIVSSEAQIIEPPTDIFRRSYTKIHGLTLKDCKGKPSFAEFYLKQRHRFEQADYLAAHNAGFDRSVLFDTLLYFDITPPKTPFLNTLPMARKLLNIKSAPLNIVADRLGIELVHHEAASDANACAEIVIKSQSMGLDISNFVMKSTERPKPSKPPQWNDAEAGAKDRYLYPWRQFFEENQYDKRPYSDFEFRLRGFKLKEEAGEKVDFTVDEILADPWIQDFIARIKAN